MVAGLVNAIELYAKVLFLVCVCVDNSGPSFLCLILLLFMFSNRFPNTTHEGFNVTLHTTLVVTTKLVLPTPAKPILPVQTGEQAQQEEQSSGMTIFFSLLVLGECGSSANVHRNTSPWHFERLCALSVWSTPGQLLLTVSSLPLI